MHDKAFSTTGNLKIKCAFFLALLLFTPARAVGVGVWFVRGLNQAFLLPCCSASCRLGEWDVALLSDAISTAGPSDPTPSACHTTEYRCFDVCTVYRQYILEVNRKISKRRDPRRSYLCHADLA